MPNPSIANDVTVVVRTVGERTEAICRRLLEEQVPAEHIVTVSNAPFSATLADSFRAGISKGQTWTLCIDADVLVAPNVITQLLQLASQLDPAVCEIQGLVLDKFFGVQRPAGNHLYRTCLLHQALHLIPEEGKAIRPEYHTLNRMAEQGHPWVEVPLVLGLHDFEQHDRDIFRKCYVHARKFDTLMPLLVDYWRRRTEEDSDYRVALAGLAAGISEIGDVRIDVRRDCGFIKWASDRSWSEKSMLVSDAINSAGVARILATWNSPGEELVKYASGNARRIVHGQQPAKPEPPRKVGSVLRRIPGTMGHILGRAGRRLERLSR
jgi:hypothetical protein